MPATREMVAKAQFHYKIAFDHAARNAGGHVIWCGQHSMLWGMLGHEISRHFWLGVCAGLAIEWLKEQAAPGLHNFTDAMMAARTEVFSRPAESRKRALEFGRRVQGSHLRQNSATKGLESVAVNTAPSFTSPYPFSKMTRMDSKFRNGTIFYISSGGHAMGAHKVGRNKFDFYDPNVGVAHDVKVSMFGSYLQAAVDATVKVRGVDTRSSSEMTIHPFLRT